MRRWCSFSALSLLALMPALAQAQAWPAKPVRFILNVSVGVLSDVVMRVGVQELQKSTGQPWVIENRQGGKIGRAHV